MTSPTLIEDSIEYLRQQRQYLKNGKAPTHSSSTHDFEKEDDVVALRRDLLSWYDKEQRSMPWRKHTSEPPLTDDKELAQRAYEGN
jgi:hypothetical protein